MTLPNMKWTKLIAAVLILGLTAACTLPRTGPTKNQLFSGSVQRAGDAFVVEVNDRVTRATAVAPALGFSQEFASAGLVISDTIQPGDTLSLTVWENVDDGLLSGVGGSQTLLQEVQVDSSGFIFVPYAGRIRAAGNTPEAIRQIITSKLDEQTPDPQVEVRRVAGDGATVSLVGAVGSQGVYPITQATRTLSTMMAAAGGVTIEPEIAQVIVIRGNSRSQIWFQDLFDNPELDIALRGGDRILVDVDTRSFTAIGATGQNARLPFPSPTISAVEALAQVGGLDTRLSDPTGVFVLRNEPAEVANQVLGSNDLVGSQRLIYALDLTKPNAMFLARDFAIRDQDTVLVTEAPWSQTAKVLAPITSSLGTIGSINNLTN